MTSLREFRWYHGPVSRPETERLLNGQQPGIYLVRDSNTISGDYVLSVSENSKVSHYIINNKSNHYKIGEQTFPNIPSIINFYKDHFLDTTTLIGAVEREMKVRALYNFEGNDADDLPFKKGDILVVIKQDEEEWWTAENNQGRRGMIPKPYVEILSETAQPAPMTPVNNRKSTPIVPSSQRGRNTDNYFDPHPSLAQQRKSLPNISNPDAHRFESPQPTRPEPVPKQPTRDQPLLARAVIDRVCSPYDQRQLPFKKGDLLKVTLQNDNGIWEGDLNEKSGEFPMSHVKLIDPETMEPYSNGY